MIAPMSRVALIVSATEKKEALANLANTNLFHVGSLDNYNDSIAALHHKLTHAESVLRYLPDTDNVELGDKKIDINQLIQSIETTYTLRADKEKIVKLYQQELETFIPWGEFSVENLHYLAQAGHFIRLYKMDAKSYKNAQSELHIPLYLCNVIKGVHYVAAYSVDEDKFPALESIPLPTKNLPQMRQELIQLRNEMAELYKELVKLSHDRPYLERYIADLQESIEFERTFDAMENHEELSLLRGFVPTEDITTLKTYAQEHGWALLMQDALTGDEEADAHIPTKVKPNFFGKFVQPMLSSFGFVPGYQEVDISGTMFLFFAIFFAMIIGDAGYGSIFLVVSLALILKLKSSGKAINPFIPYIAFMSLVTITWGILTDNWFGTAISSQVSFLKPLKSEFLSQNEGVQFLSFILGFVHLVIAHIWSFFRRIKRNPKSLLVDVGQLMMLSGLLFLITNMIIGDFNPLGDPPEWMVPAIGIGFALVLLFGEQEPGINIIKGILRGLQFDKVLAAVLGAIGNFADILSYIRLYAVGLAGFSIAASFNQLASGLPIFISIIILLLAHTLNIMLSVLSVVVHALRLNSLEFSGHVGLSWSGSAYKPFTAKQQVNIQDK